MELPSFLPVDELRGKITESLRAMSPMAFDRMTINRVEHGGKPLADDATLAALGLWDGGVLDIVAIGGVLSA
jgi:hypothetical protein